MTRKCPKDREICSFSWSEFKVQRSTRLLPKHEPRNRPCPGSDTTPVSSSVNHDVSAASQNEIFIRQPYQRDRTLQDLPATDTTSATDSHQQHNRDLVAISPFVDSTYRTHSESRSQCMHNFPQWVSRQNHSGAKKNIPLGMNCHILVRWYYLNHREEDPAGTFRASSVRESPRGKTWSRPLHDTRMHLLTDRQRTMHPTWQPPDVQAGGGEL